MQAIVTPSIAIAGVGVVWIISVIRDGLTLGLAGVVLVLMFNFGFFRLLFVPSLISGLTVCLAYNVAAVVSGLSPSMIFANNFFLISALISGASITYLLERLFRTQFVTDRALAQQNQTDRRYLEWLRHLSVFLRHEVRQPVAQISSSIEIVEVASKNDERLKPYLASAGLGARHVWNLVERASQATDAEAYVRQSRPQQIDLQHLLSEQLTAYRQANSGLRFSLQGPASMPIYADPTLIKEAIDNLLGNASSYAIEDSVVEITLDSDKVTAIVKINNTGPTIDGDTEQLFNAFRSTRSTPSGEHHGLGLYLVRLIAEQHGGRAMMSNLGDGSGVQASITLPLVT
jgi:signal transduction histidine kinase